MASWFIVWFPVAFGAMSLKINKKDVTAHRIINSAKPKKNCLRFSCFTLDWLVCQTNTLAFPKYFRCSSFKSNINSSLVNSWV